jgi:formiminotetrahydrofolate cyclodeaminase
MVVGAAACGLVAMVARICAASPKYAAVLAAAERIAAAADTLAAEFLRLRIEDESAFEAVVAARGDREAMQHALSGAAQAPLSGAQDALDALVLAREALLLRNKNLISDLGCAAEFAYAAARACIYNVQINHTFMHDRDLIDVQHAEIGRIGHEANAALEAIRAAMPF